jgi:hypothetical protein
MRRALFAAFLGAAGLLVGGFVLVVGSAAAAGDWWLARQPWIGLGLDLLVTGLAGVHLAGPPLILGGITPSPRRGAVAYGLLIAVVALLLAMTRIGPAMALELLVVVFLIGLAWVVVVVAWRRPAVSAVSSAIVVYVVGISCAALATWWLVAATGGYAVVGGPGPRPPPSLADVGTLIYSLPEFAALVPGAPTVALIALVVIVAAASGQRRGERRRVTPC